MNMSIWLICSINMSIIHIIIPNAPLISTQDDSSEFIDLKMEQDPSRGASSQGGFAGSVETPSKCNSRASSEEVWCWWCRNSSGITAYSGIYCSVQSLGTGTGPKIWEIHFSWMLSGHHLHKSAMDKARTINSQVFNNFPSWLEHPVFYS